jgi:hypothetical protein
LNGAVGSEGAVTPGQCRVVVTCGNPAPLNDPNAKYLGGSPCGISDEDSKAESTRSDLDDVIAA